MEPAKVSEHFKLQTPIKCTTPQKGMLQLNTTNTTLLKPPAYQHCLPLLPISEAVTIKRIPVHKGDAQRSPMLTKFPVLLPRRPLELLSDQIHENSMSCSELKKEIQTMNVKEYFNPQPPSFTPATSFTNHSRTVHTHSSAGPLNISITVTRHSAHMDPLSTRPSTNYMSTYTFESSVNKRRSGSAKWYSRRHLRPASGLRQSGGHSIAPLSLNAMMTHQNQPITPKTQLNGKRVILA